MPKKPTKAEQAHMNQVAALGCIPCRLDGIPGSPACIHHAKTALIRSRDNMKVIGMCPQHHQHGQFCLSRHGDPKEFAEKYGDDDRLLEIVDELLRRD
jgi:hypothetical protein